VASRTVSDNDNPRGADQSANGGSVAGYFRRLFQENPGWLSDRSNDEPLRRWLADHPDQTEVPQKVKVGLQNVKNILRKRLTKKIGRPRKDRVSAPVAETAAVPETHRASSRLSRKDLDNLEHQIDGCLMSARGMDQEGLAEVINHLRRARNAVIGRMGE
jgi:hypothetical protein